jgi:hypothetical protein
MIFEKTILKKVLLLDKSSCSIFAMFYNLESSFENFMYIRQFRVQEYRIYLNCRELFVLRSFKQFVYSRE